jgi:hypothetical protein
MRGFAALLFSLFLQQPAPGGELEQKLEEIRLRYENGSKEAKDYKIQEVEANEYLRAQKADLPEGVESPWMKFQEGIAVVGATVDLEKFRANLPDSMLFQLLRGRVPVEIEARFEGDKGVGKLDLQRVSLGGLDLPETLVETMSSSETATRILPPGFRLGEPFELPYDLETIRCLLGAVHLHQRPSTVDKQ